MGAWAWFKRNVLVLYSGVVVAYMLIPILVIALFSFGDTPAGKLTFGLDSGFTLEYWKDAFAISELNEALVKSIQLAALAALAPATSALVSLTSWVRRGRARRSAGR